MWRSTTQLSKEMDRVVFKWPVSVACLSYLNEVWKKSNQKNVSKTKMEGGKLFKMRHNLYPGTNGQKTLHEETVL